MDKAIFKLSYGMYVLGTTAEDLMPTGCIVNTAFQITSDPQTVAVSVNYNNFTNVCIKNTREFTLSVLSEMTDQSVIGRFGFASGRDTNKFDGIKYKTVMNHMPVLTENICAWLHCQVENIVDVGTHAIFIGRVIDSEVLDSALVPMTYSYYRNVIKGVSPKNAPTFVAEPEPSAEDVYVCGVCGYEFKGDFENLPDDWVCPICKAPKSKFIKKK